MKYVAFIRGIGPENPNMHGAKLKWFFEELGFKNVQTVLSSGNVIFESETIDKIFLEKYIEDNLPMRLQFSRAVIIRDYVELAKLIKSDPFNGTDDTPSSRLNVTFLKNGEHVFSVIDAVTMQTTRIMSQLEKAHGKDITTRTWKTIKKILKRME